MKVRDLIPEPLLLEMARVTHDSVDGTPSPHHLEGSVLTHTLMVVDAMLEAGASTEMLITGVLHDIGKTKSVKINEKNGHRMFSGHEAMSFYMAIDILDKLDLSFDSELVLKLIAMHGDLWRFGSQEKSEERFASIKDKEIYTMIREFSAFDRLGSISDYTAVPRVVLPNRYDSLSVTESVSPSALGEATLHILVGPPGSGKDTFLKSNLMNAHIISRDDLVNEMSIGSNYNEKFRYAVEHTEVNKEIDRRLQVNFTNAKRTGNDVVINMTNMSAKSRRKWLANWKGKAIAYVFKTCYNDLLERNTVTRTDKRIGKEVLHRMIESFVYPKHSEGFDKVKMV